MRSRSRVRVEKSSLTRQAILDACFCNILTLRQIAEKLDVKCQGLNIHLLHLVDNGYLLKQDKVAKYNSQWACGYTTISDKPYVWKYTAPTKQEEVVVIEQPTLDIDFNLMVKLGYTNITPRLGKVHRGLISNDAKNT
jgi:hypothetical protein